MRQHEGKEICLRYSTGKCTSKSCRFLHVCPIPDASGKACGQPHPASKHAATPHSRCRPGQLEDAPASSPPPQPAACTQAPSGPRVDALQAPVSSPPGDTSETSESAVESDSPAAMHTPRLLLDLFSGFGSPVSAAAAELDLDRFEPVDLLSGPAIDVLDDGEFQLLRQLCASGVVGAAVAAPPCAAFSRARLRPGGPKPVRTPCAFDGLPHLDSAQQHELDTSEAMHERSRELLARCPRSLLT